LDGDTYTVNGQKMWTSGAQYSDWCVLLVRTNTEVPKHKGITCLLTSLDVPGVEVRPIVLADRDPETSEVFWDNVQVPADQRLGNEGDGWRIAMTTVSYERGPADVGIIANYRRALKEAETLAADRGLIDDPEIRRQLAMGYVEGEVLRPNVAEQLSARVSGKLPGPEGSMSHPLWPWAQHRPRHAAPARAVADDATG